MPPSSWTATAAGPWRAGCRAWPGHRAGADAVRRTVEAAPELGIGILTLFAFSSDNWRRPPEEVSGLMQLAGRASALGDQPLPGERRAPGSDRPARPAGQRTGRGHRAGRSGHRGGRKLHLRIAVDYSGREAITEAVRQAAHAGLVCRECLEEQLGPPVDLLIRTGGEQRLSDFLLWECAYAELIFSRRMWPDFDAPDLEAAVRQFHCAPAALRRECPLAIGRPSTAQPSTQRLAGLIRAAIGAGNSAPQTNMRASAWTRRCTNTSRIQPLPPAGLDQARPRAGERRGRARVLTLLRAGDAHRRGARRAAAAARRARRHPAARPLRRRRPGGHRQARRHGGARRRGRALRHAGECAAAPLRSRSPAVGGDLRPGIVHRLDRYTSGVLLVAKNDAAHRALAAQFAGRAGGEDLPGAGPRRGASGARPHREAHRARSACAASA